MTESLKMVLFITGILIVLAGFLFLSAFKGKRAIARVVAIFYQHDALDGSRAKTLRELGLERPDLVQRMTSPRDYKQYALQILVKGGVIHSSEDGKLYMVEENLDENLRRKLSVYRETEK